MKSGGDRVAPAVTHHSAKPALGGGSARGSATGSTTGSAKALALPKPTPTRLNAPTQLNSAQLLSQVEGMVPIPKQLWPELSDGDRIKYVDVDGKFHSGGYVRGVYVKDDVKYLSIEVYRSNNKKIFPFSTRLDRISAIYKRPSVDYIMLSVEIVKLRKDIEALRSSKG